MAAPASDGGPLPVRKRQLAPFHAEVELLVFDPRQLRLPARERFQERRLHRRRPTGQAQQLDPAHGLDHPRIECGVVKDVGRLIHGGCLLWLLIRF
jgi:hypothetical protein